MKGVEVDLKKAKVFQRGHDIFRLHVHIEARKEASCKLEEYMDHVLTWLEWEDNSFCEMGDVFVEVAFLM
jgi:hypothetical protein